MAVQRCATDLSPIRMPERQASADERLYFSVRSMGVSGASHLLQYAFADDRGNVVLSTVSAAPRPMGLLAGELPSDLAFEPMTADVLNGLLGPVCQGASLVAFGRVLQTGLLPTLAAQAAHTVDCAWRRFLRISRQRGLAFNRHEPLTLSDALESAGLKPLESSDAALRALAIRDLWMWMDRVELRAGEA
jgi:hypothetical protein